MRKYFLPCIKATLSIMAIFISSALFGQYTLTAFKDDTHPEQSRQLMNYASIVSFSAIKNNGYNEIQWVSRNDQDVKKFIVEFTTDGINYQSAGEMIHSGTGYLLKHQTFEVVPLLYRLRIEDVSGRFYYSPNFLLDGLEAEPVKIYPTLITGHTVNVIADFPVEKIIVVSGSGQQVYTQDVNGKSASMAIAIPKLGKGIYFMSFQGQGWRSTSRFIIP
jgi:hypothetical protein